MTLTFSRPLVVFIACAAASGCGGGTKTGQQVKACLANQAALEYPSTDKADLDLISENAGDLGIAIDQPRGQEIQIVVERSESDAQATKRSYDGFAEAAGSGHVDRSGNVVVAYSKTPTSKERSAVEKCTG